jgi:hypothetical protein
MYFVKRGNLRNLNIFIKSENFNLFSTNFYFKSNIIKNFCRSTSTNKISSQSSNFKNKKSIVPKKQLTKLDKEAFKEEIKVLLEKNDQIKLYDRLNYMVNHYLNEEDLTDEAIKELSDHTILLSDVLRELERIEESSLKQREVLIKLENSDKIENPEESDALYFIKFKLLDRISFDNFVLQRYQESKEASEELISLVKKRIAQDKLTLIDDRCTLFASILNLIQIKTYTGASKEDIMEDLKTCLEIFNQHKNKLEANGFKFFRALALTYYEMGNIDESIKSCKTSLKYKQMEGDEDSEDTFLVYRCLGDNYSILGDKEKSEEFYFRSIKIKEELLYSLSHEELQLEGREHFTDVGRIYEILGENKLLDGDLEKSEEFINKSLENYLKYPVDHIFVANCYLILGEINLESKKLERSLEYSKKYISAVEKFIKSHEHEINNPTFDLDYYTRLSIPTHQSNIYKALKYITQAYCGLGDKINCKKYGQLAVDKLVEINKDSENSESDSEMIKYQMSDFLNYKYELIKLYELMNAIPLALKEYDEIISKLNSTQVDKIFFEREDDQGDNKTEKKSNRQSSPKSGNKNKTLSLDSKSDQNEPCLENSSFISKNYFLVDALYNKADYFIKLERYPEAKKLLAETQKIIHERNIKIEPEREDDINSKINLINLKMRKEAEDDNNKKSKNS